MSGFIEIITNYLFIQGSILFFIAPFYWAYQHRHPEISLKHLVLNENIERFLSSTQANYLAFAWAAAEAICWFIIPEFLLLLVIFLRVKNKRALLIADILGTTFGTIIGLLLSVYTNFNVVKVPYITSGMIEQVKVWYQSLGSLGMFYQPFSGVPYKVFVMSVHQFDINLVWFVSLAILIRIARYYIFYLIFVGLYPFLHRRISHHYLPIFLLSCFIFSVMFLRVYKIYNQGYELKNAPALTGAQKLR